MTPLLKVDEVCAVLVCDEPTVNKLVRSGRLKGITLPDGSVRVTPSALDEFISGSATPSPYMTHAEAAAYCRRSEQTLYNRSNEIRKVKGPGGKSLYLREDLDRWLAGKKKAA